MVKGNGIRNYGLKGNGYRALKLRVKWQWLKGNGIRNYGLNGIKSETMGLKDNGYRARETKG